MNPNREQHERQFRRLSETELDLGSLPDQLLGALQRAVPFDAFCWGAVDPVSLLPTRATGTTIPAGSPLLWEVQELALCESAANTIRSLAYAASPVALLSQTAGGRKEDCPMYQRILGPLGFEHQLRAALVLDGSCWGFLNIERRPERPDFSSSEVALVEALVPHLAHAFRRWLLADANGTSRDCALPGLIILDEGGGVESISEETERWLAEWGLSGLMHPPAAITAVVAAARARANGCADGPIPAARLRLPSGTWLQVRATSLNRTGGKRGIAVVLEPARPEAVAPLVARAHRLTPRETEIAVLVVRGQGTAQIAARLSISPYTVQDHLKAIFEKVGVRSRRELASEIFEPHLRAA